MGEIQQSRRCTDNQAEQDSAAGLLQVPKSNIKIQVDNFKNYNIERGGTRSAVEAADGTTVRCLRKKFRFSGPERT